MSNLINLHFCLFSKLSNHAMTSFVLLHCRNFILALIILLILSIWNLAILPSSDLARLMRRHEGLLWKFSLWSLSVTNASRWGKHSILSSNFRFCAIFFASLSTSSKIESSLIFRYDVVVLLKRSFLTRS